MNIFKRNRKSDFDYGGLEQSIRSKAPADKYGYLSYLMSPEHRMLLDDEKHHYHDGGFSFDQGYNCFDISMLTYRELTQRGRNPEIVFGADGKGIFRTHCWCVDEKQTVDATPLFSFVGEKHSKRKNKFNPEGYHNIKYLDNPLTIAKKEGSTFFIGIKRGIWQTDGKDIPVWGRDSQDFSFELNIHEIETNTWLNEGYVLDIPSYRNSIRQENTPDLSWEDISSLNEYKIIRKRIHKLNHPEWGAMELKPGCSLLEYQRLERIHKEYSQAIGMIFHKVAYAEND